MGVDQREYLLFFFSFRRVRDNQFPTLRFVFLIDEQFAQKL